MNGSNDETPVVALESVTKTLPAGRSARRGAARPHDDGERRRVHGHQRPVGVRQDHRAQPDRRPGHPDVGHRAAWRARTSGRSPARSSEPPAPRPHRLRVPGLQPAAGPQRLRECRDRDGRPGRRRGGAPGTGHGAAGPGGARGHGAPAPVGALGRPAAARRHRAGEIAARPAVVLADEPTANVDSATAESLLEMMEALNREQQVTFLFSTHDPRVMARARRLVRLVDGRIESDDARG